MMRIVSLLPSATEIVCALGMKDCMAGRSHECDYPPGVERLPALTAPRFDPEGASAEVDRRVKSILQNALSVYRVDADQLMALRPDVIVTQSQCEVCAVSENELNAALAQSINGPSPLVVSLKAASLEGVVADIERVAAALDVERKGAELTASIRQRMRRISERAAGAGSRPSLATIEWIDPLMSGGNWMPELIEIAGGRNLFGRAGEHSPRIGFDQLAAANPDAILIAPCGFGIERSLRELPALSRNPRWQRLAAVRSGRVYVADGNHYFNRPGPRLAESAEILAEILHPKLFDFGRQGEGWRRLP